jgi:5-methylcytosine-specific restriction endonuclease McrA
MQNDSSRWCYRCDEWKAPTEFYSRYKFCKECRKQDIRAWEAKNPERVADSKKRWKQKNPDADAQHYQANKERIKARTRNYYEENREQLLEQRRVYARANLDARVEYKRQWRKDNPEKHRAQSMRRRALKLASGGECDATTIQEMYESQQGLCAYCETVLFGSFHVDHMVPLSRGGRNDWTNLAITCADCNLSKAIKTVEEFFNCRSQTSHF